MRRASLALLVAALAVLCGPAQAQTQTSIGVDLVGYPAGAQVLSQVAIPLQTQGEAVVSFRGDASAGCATYGLCAYAGTVVVPPQVGELTVVTFRQRGRIGRTATLELGNGFSGYGASARVQRSAPGGQGGTCADAQAASFGIVLPVLTHGGSITIRLFAPGGSLLQTRCAGPLDGDLASVSPTVTLPVSKLVRGRTVVDLSGTRTFAVHGFAGTLSSTVVLHLGRPQPQSSGAGFPPGFKTQRTRIVTEHLSLARVTGQLGMAVRGTDDPIICRLLDTCGLTGTLTLGRLGKQAGAQLIAEGPASRPDRDFLTALGVSRGGRTRGIGVVLLVNLLGGVDETTTQAGVTCTDATGTGGVATEGAVVGSGGLLGSSPGLGAFAGSWRTSCPGPILNDLSGGVTSSLAAGALSHREFTVHIRATGSLTDDGYAISPSGRLSVLMRRGRITQQVITLPAG